MPTRSGIINPLFFPSTLAIRSVAIREAIESNSCATCVPFRAIARLFRPLKCAVLRGVRRTIISTLPETAAQCESPIVSLVLLWSAPGMALWLRGLESCSLRKPTRARLERQNDPVSSLRGTCWLAPRLKLGRVQLHTNLQ